MRRFLVSLFLVFISQVIFAQGISFKPNAPLSVSQGGRFQVVFTLTNAEGKDFAPPKFEGAKLSYGPAISTGQSVVMINGQTQSSSYQTFTYTLDAVSSSKIVIGSASVSAGGKRYGTKPITIEVVASASPAGASNGHDNAGPSKFGAGANDVVVRMEFNPKTVYKGEAVLAQIKLYTRAQAQIMPDKFPAFNGFWAQELPAATQSVRATLNGKPYESQVLRQWLLYPQKTGKLEIEQTTVNAYIQFAVPVDMPFGGPVNMIQSTERKLTAPSVLVDIKPLPTAGMPADFAMALGRFTLSSTISSRILTANSSGTIKLTLKGTGNFPLIDAPTIIFPEGIDGYEPKMSESVTNTENGTTGERSWEYPFVVRSMGEFNIEPVEFSYFDPKTERYHTLRSESYPITVTRDPNAGKGTIVTTFSGDEDIKPLRTSIPEVRSGELWLFSFSFFGVVVVILVTFLVTLWFLRRQMSLRADVVGRKLKRASRVALSKLKKAKGFMNTGNRDAFFEEMLRAMWGFVADKFNMDLASMSKENIGAQFADRGYDADIATEFLDIVNECEFARYAPASSGDMRTIYNGTLSLFSNLT